MPALQWRYLPHRNGIATHNDLLWDVLADRFRLIQLCDNLDLGNMDGTAFVYQPNAVPVGFAD